jgi:hypothetical protein
MYVCIYINMNTFPFSLSTDSADEGEGLGGIKERRKEERKQRTGGQKEGRKDRRKEGRKDRRKEGRKEGEARKLEKQTKNLSFFPPLTSFLPS